jgi:hypothetical protein
MKRRLICRVHFNRINMQRGNPNVWTVHNSRGCFQGKKVVSLVPMQTVYKPEARQPRAYFVCKAVVHVHGSTIVLTIL